MTFPAVIVRMPLNSDEMPVPSAEPLIFPNAHVPPASARSTLRTPSGIDEKPSQMPFSAPPNLLAAFHTSLNVCSICGMFSSIASPRPLMAGPATSTSLENAGISAWPTDSLSSPYWFFRISSWTAVVLPARVASPPTFLLTRSMMLAVSLARFPVIS